MGEEPLAPELIGLENVEILRDGDTLVCKATLRDPAPFTDGHFDGQPILPGFVQLSWIYSLVTLNAPKTSPAFSLKNVKFLKTLHGGELIEVSIKSSSYLAATFSIVTENEQVLKGTFTSNA